MSNPRTVYETSAYARQLKAHYTKEDPGVCMAESVLSLIENERVAFIESKIEAGDMDVLLCARSYLTDIADATERLAAAYESRLNNPAAKQSRADARALHDVALQIGSVINTYERNETNDSRESSRTGFRY